MSNEYTHTPGPWMIFPGGIIGSASVRRAGTTVVKAGEVKGETIGEAMCNARLIAAAPDLLEACHELLARLDHLDPDNNDSPMRQMARAAIAKSQLPTATRKE